MSSEPVNDVENGTIGRIHQQLRTARPPCLTCSACGGKTILLRDELCKYCFDERVYHA